MAEKYPVSKNQELELEIEKLAFGGKGFWGDRVHEAVIRSGAKFSGCTVHFVDAGVDTGPIIAQAVVPVLDDDTEETLAARILRQEHRLFPHAIRLFAEGRLRLEGRRVVVDAPASGADGAALVNPPLPA